MAYIKQFIQSVHSNIGNIKMDEDLEAQLLLAGLLEATYKNRHLHRKQVIDDIVELYDIHGEFKRNLYQFLERTSNQFMQDSDFAHRVLDEAQQLGLELNQRIIQKRQQQEVSSNPITDGQASQGNTTTTIHPTDDNKSDVSASNTDVSGSGVQAREASGSGKSDEETDKKATLSERDFNNAKSISNVGGLAILSLVEGLEKLYKYQHMHNQLSTKEKAAIALHLLKDDAYSERAQLLHDIAKDKETIRQFLLMLSNEDNLDEGHYGIALNELYNRMGVQETATLATAYSDTQKKLWRQVKQSINKLDTLLQQEATGRDMGNVDIKAIANSLTQKLEALKGLREALHRAYNVERGLAKALHVKKFALSAHDIQSNIQQVEDSIKQLVQYLQSIGEGAEAQHPDDIIAEITREYDKAIRILTTASTQYFEQIVPRLAALIRASVKKLGAVSFDKIVDNEGGMELFRFANASEGAFIQLQDLHQISNTLNDRYKQANISPMPQMHFDLSRTQWQQRMQELMETLWARRVMLSTARNAEKTAEIEGAVSLEHMDFDPRFGGDVSHIIVPVTDTTSLAEIQRHLGYALDANSNNTTAQAEAYEKYLQKVAKTIQSPNTSSRASNTTLTHKQALRHRFLKYLANLGAKKQPQKNDEDSLNPCQIIDLYKYLS